MRIRSIFAVTTSITIGFLFAFAQGTAAQTAEIRILASNGVKAVLEEILPQGERAIGHPLATQFNTTAALKDRIEGGEGFDVAILTSEVIDDLIHEGKIAGNTRAEVSRTGVGIGIRAGAPKPDIRTPEAVKRILLNAKSITYGDKGASRPSITRMLERLGISRDVQAKTFLVQQSEESTARVAEGRTELVITLISEILPVHGIELLGPLPPEFQNYISFAAGASAGGKNTEAARALIKFLTGPTAAPIFKARGMEPR